MAASLPTLQSPQLPRCHPCLRGMVLQQLVRPTTLQMLLTGGLRIGWLQLQGQQGSVVYENVTYTCDAARAGLTVRQLAPPCIVRNVTYSNDLLSSLESFGQLPMLVRSRAWACSCLWGTLT